MVRKGALATVPDGKSRHLLIGFMLLLMLAGCGGAGLEAIPSQMQDPPESGEPSPPPTATSRFPVVVGVEGRPTLPPSWTPTFTPTITLTPTPTNTPTITPTPSITPTYTVAELCENFTGAVLVFDGIDYVETGYVDYFLGSSLPEMTVEMRAYNQTTDEEWMIALPGGQMFIGKLALNALVGPGRYALTVTANTAEQSGLCAETFEFTIVAPSFMEQIGSLLATLAATLQEEAEPTPTPTD